MGLETAIESLLSGLGVEGGAKAVPDVTTETSARGETLATLRRCGGEQLRVVCDEWMSHRFATLRIWFRNEDGVMMPSPRGLSIRPREFAEVLSALHEIARRLGVECPECNGSASPIKSRGQDRVITA